MDISQLQSLLGNSEEDKQSALNMGLLQAGLGILANNTDRRNHMPAIAKGGMMGIQGYQQALSQSQAEAIKKIQMAELLDKFKRKQQQEAALANADPRLRQAVEMGVPVGDAWKHMNPELKPQIVDIADPNEPLRTIKQWVVPGQSSGITVGPGTLPEILDPRVQAAKQAIAAAGKSETKVFNNTKDDFKNERDLRNDFSGLPTTKAFREVESAHSQISTALRQQTPAGDLAGATKIMKILDPGSVVRESELGMAMQASGLLDRVTNYADMVMKGTKLTPKQRMDFQNLADQLYKSAADIYDKSAEEYQSVAKDYNLNPGRVAKKATGMATTSGGDLAAAAAAELKRRGAR